MSQKKYTIKDWRHGQISLDYESNQIDGIDQVTKGKLPYKLYSKGLLSKEDYLEIKREQEDAFRIAVELTVKTLDDQFQKKLKSAPNPDRLLNIRIEELEEMFDNYKAHIKESVFAGEADTTGINFLKYVLIKHPEILLEKEAIDKKPSKIHLSNPSGIPDSNKRSRAIKFATESLVTVFSAALGKKEIEGLPKEIEPLHTQNLVYNKTYDATVTWNYLEKLRTIGKAGSNTDKTISQEESSYPEPFNVAKKFKTERTKSGDDTYSISDIAFVMKYAKKYPDISNYAELIRKYQKDSECPANIKDIKYDTAQNWITSYDDIAEIKRKEETDN